ncbi:MAG: HVA1 family protein [Pleurocapsa sp. MO_192.B19]|nr:HVA1 family protein [Pleurocapsa sp. MO_192.B19]
MGQKQIRTGSPVSWDWGNGTAEGKVKEIHHEKITKKIGVGDLKYDVQSVS